jgi:uncharacterized heparinase superfamily protein
MILISINKIILIIHTIKYLKYTQLYFRVFRKLFRPKVTEIFQGNKPSRSKKWSNIPLYDLKIKCDLNSTFLNYSKRLNFPIDWNSESPSKLWVYNLHYFEVLLSDKAFSNPHFYHELLIQWVNENPVGFGNGWEPYPTSLRVVNILKAWLGGQEMDEKILISVFSQTSYLSNNLEKHLLGNHYFVNLKALLFSGVLFDNTRWIKIAERGLLSEIPEQVLLDGGNFELSPMYHALMLVDMLDMLNLYRAYSGRISSKLGSLIDSRIEKMLMYMDAMAHPDGGVSFFNDSVNGIAPSKDKIERYASTMGFASNYMRFKKPTIIDNSDSGYICATVAACKLIFDASSVGPDYIPGHAHADTLSFEMSIDLQRVFVNSGISEYGLSPKRIRQRKTLSHNTIEVDGKDSSQVWSSFRVAKRARVIDRFFELKSDNSIMLRAAHDGYKSFWGGCIHERTIKFSKNALSVSDSLKGSFRYAKSRFYFHPSLTISIQSYLLTVEGPKFVLQCDLTGKIVSLTDSFWCPEFGLELPNKVLEVQFQSNQLEVKFAWVSR